MSAFYRYVLGHRSMTVRLRVHFQWLPPIFPLMAKKLLFDERFMAALLKKL